MEDERGRRFEVSEGLKAGDRVAAAVSGTLGKGTSSRSKSIFRAPGRESKNRNSSLYAVQHSRRPAEGLALPEDKRRNTSRATPMKLAEICVRHPVFTVMLIAFLVTLGLFSYRGLAVDLFPKAGPATVNVEVRLPGATPEEIVTGIVLPLEDAI